MALMAGLAMTAPGAMARQMADAGIPGNENAALAGTSGIRIDRLSPKQRRIWASISRIVLAADAAGNPMHPKLHDLWRSIDESGCTTYIEMPKATTVNKAG